MTTYETVFNYSRPYKVIVYDDKVIVDDKVISYKEIFIGESAETEYKGNTILLNEKK